MELKIKIGKGNYALRTFDKNGNQIYYTSSRLNGFNYVNNELVCNVPDESETYQLKELTTLKIVSQGEINANDRNKNIHNKSADLSSKK
ncbi:Hypothetical protein IALB_0075 [Ignavibacterium album JCM 16511]|uniref:Uncharacterized protein n=1 Tax=Ignavibacterium album (strain DSM 19864 / JCM 16511 / NBRC 101810 / Mat9-16) TaxID=945713 RepID=I0AFN2_IGNAJ|nr:hypothetical protein [Ignavibacterium album]AFH47789.1 Hypothetical protein IALB_0075 [Ignavibacterium album JCM 16511]